MHANNYSMEVRSDPFESAKSHFFDTSSWGAFCDVKGRGYEYAKNAYIPVDDDELEALAIESKHTIEIDSFVPREQIDERYLDSPYYITPDGQVGQDAFAVIREAMRGKGMVALECPLQGLRDKESAVTLVALLLPSISIESE